MKVIVKSLILSLGLVSCGAPVESRYRDTALLERPPTLPVTHQSAEQPALAEHKLGQTKMQQEHEEPSVYMNSTTPPLLMIRQPLKLGWNTLGHALKQDYLKVSDRQQEKGLYFISYNPQILAEKDSGFFDKAIAILKKVRQEEYYVLTVTEQHLETQVSISVNQQQNTTADGSSAADGSTPVDELSPSAEDADKLLLLIYKSMSDKPQPDKHEEKKNE
jgi:NlpB/DapX lipoprotein